MPWAAPGRRASCPRALRVSSPTSTSTSCWSSAPWRPRPPASRRPARWTSSASAQMVDFTRNFTDGDHHTKEETLLFPLLEERSPAAGGTISVLLSEHEAARDCMRAISAALPDAAGEDEERAAAGRGGRGGEPQAVRVPAAAAHRQGGHRPLQADRRAAQPRRAGGSWRGSSRTSARRRERRPSPSATTAWRTTSPADPPPDGGRMTAEAGAPATTVYRQPRERQATTVSVWVDEGRNPA